MKILKNEKLWRKWLRTDVDVDVSQIRARQDRAKKPPKFPCYAYIAARNYFYEDKIPVYLSAIEISSMQEKIVEQNAEIILLKAALERLPRLCNGDEYGNSSVNTQGNQP